MVFLADEKNFSEQCVAEVIIPNYPMKSLKMDQLEVLERYHDLKVEFRSLETALIYGKYISLTGEHPVHEKFSEMLLNDRQIGENFYLNCEDLSVPVVMQRRQYVEFDRECMAHRGGLVYYDLFLDTVRNSNLKIGGDDEVGRIYGFEELNTFNPSEYVNIMDYLRISSKWHDIWSKKLSFSK